VVLTNVNSPAQYEGVLVGCYGDRNGVVRSQKSPPQVSMLFWFLDMA